VAAEGAEEGALGVRLGAEEGGREEWESAVCGEEGRG
jgi:hypothetical protein